MKRRARMNASIAGSPFAPSIARDLLPEREVAVDLTEAREQELHHVRRADRVRESRVLRAGERIRRDAELTDATQALQLRRVHEARDDRLFFRLERHEAVHGV